MPTLTLFSISLSVLVCCPVVMDDTEIPDQRVPWTASRIIGSPEPPPPLETVVRFPHLKFDRPLDIQSDPASQRLWVVEQGGKVLSFKDDRETTVPDLFVDLATEFNKLTSHPEARGFDALYGLAFHPDYPSVPVCWITYTVQSKQDQHHLEDGTRLSRFQISFDSDGIPRCDPASERILLTWLEGGHNGACLKFGPDGMLYVSTGDGEVPNPPDPRDAGQDVTNLLSAVLRIDVMADGDDPLYQVPPDNPFVNLAGARPEIWAYGFRNPWKMSFAPDGELWLGDVGWEQFEMVHRVRAGTNGGWSIMEGPQPVRPNARRGPTEITPPAIALPHTDAASVTGGYVYRGSRFPDLRGTYIFGDFDTRRIWSAAFSNDQLASLTDLVQPALKLVAFGEDAHGELLMLDYEAGTIHELQPNTRTENTAPFPKLLSQTGLFHDTRLQQPAAGVVPFAINATMWSDGTEAHRWLAVPGTEPIEVQTYGVRRPGLMLREFLFFPKDSVLAKTVQLRTVTDERVNLETQVLHYDGEDWRAYSYIWSPDQNDAVLASASGEELELSRYGRFPESAPANWRVHSRTECLRCHNHWVGGTLAFTMAQLNRPADAASERFENQLHLLRDRGWLSGAVPDDPKHPAETFMQALMNPHEDSADIEVRARSWLSVNCAHCHQDGAGGTATIDLRHHTSIEKMGLIAKPAAQGQFDLEHAALLAPGDATASVLMYRVATAGRGHMPHIGATLPDPTGVALLRDWIESLADAPASDLPLTDSIPIELTQPSQALRWMLALDDDRLTAELSARLLEGARNSRPEISGLFERFQPAHLRRRVRSSFDTAAILARAGDPVAGRELYLGKRLQCATCHQIGTTGGKIGPVLDDVGRRLTRAQILESLLEPSKKIDPKFASWVAATTDGRVVSGLLITRGDDFVVLRNARGEDTTLATAEIDDLQPQALSLMPEKQMNDLGDEDIASLLAYLSSLTAAAPTP